MDCRAKIEYVTLAEELKADKTENQQNEITETESNIALSIDEAVEATASGFGESFRHLFDWDICDLILDDLLLCGCVYLLMSLIRTECLPESIQVQVNALSTFFAKYMGMITLSFFIGFFTQTAVSRWYSVGRDIPGVSKVIKRFIIALKPNLEDGKERVCLFTRYVLLQWMLTFRLISPPFRESFPTLASIRDGHWLTDEEYKRLLYVNHIEGPKFLPLEVYDWLNEIIMDAYEAGHIVIANQTRCIDGIQELKKGGGNLLRFISKNTPSVLARLVSIVIYTYGIVSALSSYPTEKEFSWALVWGRCFFLPQMLPYLVFLLWHKVGRILTNPFGKDREDIDVTAAFRDHVKCAYRMRRKYGNIPLSYYTSPEGLPGMRRRTSIESP